MEHTDRLTPEQWEALREDCNFDARTIGRIAAGFEVQGSTLDRLRKGAKRLGIALPSHLSGEEARP